MRFILETDDYIDPYQSYLEIEVEFDPLNYLKNSLTADISRFTNRPGTTTPGQLPVFMLDGPSTSLIS